jgi:pimeloyl-ACP methyl ester carboxylesterase
MDLPNFAKTGPIVHEVHGSVHAFQAEMGIALMEHLGFSKFHVVGNSQGGQTSMEMSWMFPERENKLVWGAGHIGVGIGMYLMSNNREEGIRAAGVFSRNPTPENMRSYLELHSADPSLITDELVDYLVKGFMREDLREARGQIKPSVEPYPDNANEMKKIQAPTLVVWGRDDRIVPLECGERYAKTMPRARLEIVEGAGHFVEMEKPSELAKLVTNFVSQGDA